MERVYIDPFFSSFLFISRLVLLFGLCDAFYFGFYWNVPLKRQRSDAALPTMALLHEIIVVDCFVYSYCTTENLNCWAPAMTNNKIDNCAKKINFYWKQWVKQCWRGWSKVFDFGDQLQCQTFFVITFSFDSRARCLTIGQFAAQFSRRRTFWCRWRRTWIHICINWLLACN